MLPLWLVEILSDFCRWRSRAASMRVRDNLASAQGWLALESSIIKGARYGKTQEAGGE